MSSLRILAQYRRFFGCLGPPVEDLCATRFLRHRPFDPSLNAFYAGVEIKHGSVPSMAHGAGGTPERALKEATRIARTHTCDDRTILGSATPFEEEGMVVDVWVSGMRFEGEQFECAAQVAEDT